MLESRTPWSQVLPFNGRFAAIGPLFVPGQTCCAACFEQRRGHALGEPELVREDKDVVLAFRLPAGSYATAVLDEVTKQQRGCVW